MKKLSKFLAYTALGIASVPAAFYIYLSAVSRGKTKPFRDEKGRIVPGSIAEITRRRINGTDTGLIIRGRDITKPVLLFIHGAPGMTEFPFTKKLNTGLEDIFVVCYWEQRGAGLSYSSLIPKEAMNVESFVEDAIQITRYLQKRFNKDRIYILGHSWGSYLGALLARDYPEHFTALISTGQVSDQTRSELLTYKHIVDIAKETRNRKALRILSKIGPPPYFINDGGVRKVSLMRFYITKLSGTVKSRKLLNTLIKSVISCREYTIKDKVNYLRGIVFTLRTMLDHIMSADLFKEVPSLRIPYYVLQGTADLQTSYPLALQYYEQINAPVRQFHAFTESAHVPLFEEPEKFNDILRSIVAEHENKTNMAVHTSFK